METVLKRPPDRQQSAVVVSLHGRIIVEYQWNVQMEYVRYDMVRSALQEDSNDKLAVIKNPIVNMTNN